MRYMRISIELELYIPTFEEVYPEYWGEAAYVRDDRPNGWTGLNTGVRLEAYAYDFDNNF